MLRQRTTITGPELLKPLPSFARQRLIVRDALGEKQPLDSIDVLDALRCQRLALATDSAAILLLWRRCSNHCAHPRLAPPINPPRADHRLPVALCTVRPAPPAPR